MKLIIELLLVSCLAQGQELTRDQDRLRIRELQLVATQLEVQRRDVNTALEKAIEEISKKWSCSAGLDTQKLDCKPAPPVLPPVKEPVKKDDKK